MHDDVERILFPEEAIHEGIDRVADEVTRAYAGTDFTVVSVLKGACVFAADRIRRIPNPRALSFFPAEGEIQGRRLLLVDDILDTGRTLAAVRRELLARGALDVRTCVFLDKPSRRTADLVPDFRCFEVEDLFVVGYGLDFAGRYRNLPFVGALRPEVFTAAAARAEERPSGAR